MPLSHRGRMMGGGELSPTAPLEDVVFDYTTFTEVDPNSRITVGANSIGFTQLPRNESSYVYKDMGVDYYSGNFKFNLDYVVTAYGSSGHAEPWALANAVNNVYTLRTSGQSLLQCAAYIYSGKLRFEVYEIIGTVLRLSGNYQGTWNSNFYLTIERDESIGTYGRLYLRVYSDVGRTTLLSEVYLDLTAKLDFRYLYGISSINTGETDWLTGSVSNLTQVNT